MATFECLVSNARMCARYLDAFRLNMLIEGKSTNVKTHDAIFAA